MKNNKGFSLVELIVVIAIMAILAAVAIPTFATFITKANIASDVSFVNDLTYAAELAHTATGGKVTEVQVTIDDGKITAAAYKVDNVVVVVNPLGADADAKVICSDANLEKAAADVLASMDWNYNFKNYKADGTYAINGADAQTLATATALTTTEN